MPTMPERERGPLSRARKTAKAMIINEKAPRTLYVPSLDRMHTNGAPSPVYCFMDSNSCCYFLSLLGKRERECLAGGGGGGKEISKNGSHLASAPPLENLFCLLPPSSSSSLLSLSLPTLPSSITPKGVPRGGFSTHTRAQEHKRKRRVSRASPAGHRNTKVNFV